VGDVEETKVAVPSVLIVSGRLLAPEQRKQIGPAVWQLFWFLSRVTTVKDGWGLIGNGEPITHDGVGRCLALSRSTVKANFRRLVKAGHIQAEVVPGGLRVRVAIPTVGTGPAGNANPEPTKAEGVETGPLTTDLRGEKQPPALPQGPNRFSLVTTVLRALGVNGFQVPPGEPAEPVLAEVRYA